MPNTKPPLQPNFRRLALLLSLSAIFCGSPSTSALAVTSKSPAADPAKKPTLDGKARVLGNYRQQGFYATASQTDGRLVIKVILPSKLVTQLWQAPITNPLKMSAQNKSALKKAAFQFVATDLELSDGSTTLQPRLRGASFLGNYNQLATSNPDTWNGALRLELSYELPVKVWQLSWHHKQSPWRELPISLELTDQPQVIVLSPQNPYRSSKETPKQEKSQPDFT